MKDVPGIVYFDAVPLLFGLSKRVASPAPIVTDPFPLSVIDGREYVPANGLSLGVYPSFDTMLSFVSSPWFSPLVFAIVSNS